MSPPFPRPDHFQAVTVDVKRKHGQCVELLEGNIAEYEQVGCQLFEVDRELAGAVKYTSDIEQLTGL